MASGGASRRQCRRFEGILFTSGWLSAPHSSNTLAGFENERAGIEYIRRRPFGERFAGVGWKLLTPRPKFRLFGGWVVYAVFLVYP